MQQTNKRFAMVLKKCLDDMELPSNQRERAIILSKLLNIPKHQAFGLLEGHFYPDEALFKRMATEFEVSPDYLKKSA